MKYQILVSNIRICTTKFAEKKRIYSLFQKVILHLPHFVFLIIHSGLIFMGVFSYMHIYIFSVIYAKLKLLIVGNLSYVFSHDAYPLIHS